MKNSCLTREQQEEIVSLIQNNKVKLTGYIRKQFKDISDSDIEDCFQNLFLRTYEKYPSFHRSLNKIGWLFKALRNIMHEFCRNKKKIAENTLPSSFVQESEEEYTGENDMIFEILTNHLSEAQIIELLLSNLSEQEQKLYILRYLDNLSTYKIAETLSLPAGTVRARLFDMKKKITKMIREDDLFDLIQKENFSKNFEHSDQN